MVFGGGGGKLVLYWGPDTKPGPFTWYCGSCGPGGAMLVGSIDGFCGGDGVKGGIPGC